MDIEAGLSPLAMRIWLGQLTEEELNTPLKISFFMRGDDDENYGNT